MAKKNDKVKEVLQMYIWGYCLANAIFDDYCEVIARIEGKSVTTVKKRVSTKSNKYYKDLKKELDKL